MFAVAVLLGGVGVCLHCSMGGPFSAPASRHLLISSPPPAPLPPPYFQRAHCRRAAGAGRVLPIHAAGRLPPGCPAAALLCPATLSAASCHYVCLAVCARACTCSDCFPLRRSTCRGWWPTGPHPPDLLFLLTCSCPPAAACPSAEVPAGAGGRPARLLHHRRLCLPRAHQVGAGSWVGGRVGRRVGSVLCVALRRWPVIDRPVRCAGCGALHGKGTAARCIALASAPGVPPLWHALTHTTTYPLHPALPPDAPQRAAQGFFRRLLPASGPSLHAPVLGDADVLGLHGRGDGVVNGCATYWRQRPAGGGAADGGCCYLAPCCIACPCRPLLCNSRRRAGPVHASAGYPS